MKQQMKNEFDFSIITIVFQLKKANRTELFRRAYDSIHAQTHKNFEHIIYDGGSQDGTLEMIREIAGEAPNVRIFSEPDDGIYDAMNKAVRVARGEYIAFLNSDDCWHDPSALKTVLNYLKTYNADYSYAPARIEDEHGTYLGELEPIIGGFLIRNPFCHQTMFTRRDLMLELGIFDHKHFQSAGDFDFIMRLLLAGKRGIHVPLNFTTYRLGGLSAVNQERSIREVCASMYRNLRPLYPELTERDCRNMWDLKVPVPLVNAVVNKLAMVESQDLSYTALTATRNGDYYLFSRYPICRKIGATDPSTGYASLFESPSRYRKMVSWLKAHLPEKIYRILFSVYHKLFAAGYSWIDIKWQLFFCTFACFRRRMDGQVTRFYLLGIFIGSREISQ